MNTFPRNKTDTESTLTLMNRESFKLQNII